MKKRKPLNIIFVTNDKINKNIEQVLIEEISNNIVKIINKSK